MTSHQSHPVRLSGNNQLTEKFHLSIGVKSLTEAVEFYLDVLGAELTFEGDYTNLDLYGTQITLKENSRINVDLPDFHFGINLPLDKFEKLEKKITNNHSNWIHTPTHTVDKGANMERQKLYLTCPSGYLIEIKGLRALTR